MVVVYEYKIGVARWLGYSFENQDEDDQGMLHSDEVARSNGCIVGMLRLKRWKKSCGLVA